MVPVPEYELVMEPYDLKWFCRHVGTNRCFSARLHVGTDCWQVWIGYRGRFTRGFAKPSYDIWFGEEQRFHGHASLHLNATYQDPSLLRARLSLELFSDLGVATPRAWHVWLTLGGQPLGLYTAIESLDAAWLKRNNLPDGAIYYAVGKGGTFGLVDPKTGLLKKFVTLGYEKCHPWNQDFSDMADLIYQISLPEGPEFEAQIAAVMNVESYLRWLAGVVFMSHTDGLVQNYALFRCQGGLWQISPWDCDGTWGRCPDGSRLPADYVALGGGNHLSARLLATPRWRQRYLEVWADVLESSLAPVNVEGKVKTIFTAIREYVLKDPNKPLRNSTCLREPALIRRYVRERRDFIRRELEDWQTK